MKSEKLNTLQGFILLIVFAMGMLWAWLMGDFAVDLSPLVWAVVVLGPALFGLTLLGVWVREFGLFKPMLPLIVVATCAAVLVGYQPWNPRTQFVRTLNSIQPGTTIEEVQNRMSQFEMGQVGDVEGMEMNRARQGTTHFVHYHMRDLGPHNNADLGTVFLNQDRVVAVSFSPD